MMKNWKSTSAFFIFVAVYVYTAVAKDGTTVETAGYVALLSSLFMMLRNDFTTEHISKIIDKIL